MYPLKYIQQTFITVIFLGLPLLILTADYGEVCNPDNNPRDCDPHEGLTCSQNGSIFTCGCTKPDQMEYNIEYKRCEFKAGFNCTTTVDEATYYHSCFDTNAFCDSRTDYICQCYEQYGNVDGKCVPSHGASCSNENPECAEGTVCKVGECHCPSIGSQYFDSVKRKCFSLPGVSCIPGQEQSPDDDVISCDIDKASCVPDLKSSTGFSCACNESLGYIEDYWLQCSRSYEISCGALEGECSEFGGLTCFNGKCVCKYGDNQRWDGSRKTCVSLEGGACGMYEEFQFDVCDEGLQCTMDRLGPQLSGVCRKVQ